MDWQFFYMKHNNSVTWVSFTAQGLPSKRITISASEIWDLLQKMKFQCVIVKYCLCHRFTRSSVFTGSGILHIGDSWLFNTLWTGDADLRLYITTVQDGWRKSAFLTRLWVPRTIHLITCHLIPKTKEPLRGIRFRTVPEILQAVERSIRTINTTGAAKGILRLPHRWQRVVHTAGDYTEGQ